MKAFTARALACVILSWSASRLAAADCNGNHVEDAEDFLPKQRGFVAPIEHVLDLPLDSEALADLDSDGDLDLAGITNAPVIGSQDGSTPSGGEATVLVLSNAGGGAFSTASSHLAGKNAVSIIAADLDRDGDIDLAVTASGLPAEGARWDGAGLWVLLNKGDGTLEAPVQHGESYRLFHLEGADLDGDGDLDLSSAGLVGEHEGAFVLFKNDGKAGFDVITPSPPDILARVPVIEVDLDGDQDIDIATFLSDVTVYLNQGDATFDGGTGYDSRALLISYGLAAVDLDGDTAPDLVVGSLTFPPRQAITVLNNKGQGAFEYGGELDAPLGGYLQSYISAGDLDGDARPDLFASSVYGQMSVHLNRGAGALPGTLYGTVAAVEPRLGDIDGDGDQDVVMGGGRGFTVTINRGDGTLLAPVLMDVGDCAGDIPFVGDLDGDGDADLVATGSEDTGPVIRKLLNDGKGAFRRVDEDVGGSNFGLICAGDMDRDGDLDLVSGAPSSLEVLLNSGDGTFRHSSRFPSDGNPESMIAVDLDRDGDLDLAAIIRNPARLAVFLGDGEGSFGALEAIPVEPGWWWRPDMQAGDLDGDAATDLAVSRFGSWDGQSATDSGIIVLLNRGGGRFREPMTHHVDCCPRRMRLADVDGDGVLDIVSGNMLRFYVLPGYGDGTFSKQRELKLDLQEGEFLAVAADLDADGYADLGFEGPGHRFILFWNRRDGTFEAAGEFPSSPARAVSDFNGDRALDIAGLYPGPGPDLYAAAVTVLTSSTLAPVSRDRNRNGVPDECELRAFHRGDTNGDGVDDISDSVVILSYLFAGTPPPGCLETADLDNDAAINLTDPIYLLRYLFQAGPAPASPGPATAPCGLDPGPPGTKDDLGCAAYEACQERVAE